MNARSIEWPPDRTTTGWRVAQVIGSVIATLLGYFGVRAWWSFVSFNAFSATLFPSGNRAGWVLIGFLMWFLPSWLSIGILATVFGLRSLVFKIAVIVGV